MQNAHYHASHEARILTCLNLASSQGSECAASTMLLLLLLLPLLLLQRQRSLSLASMRMARPFRPRLAFLGAPAVSKFKRCHARSSCRAVLAFTLLHRLPSPSSLFVLLNVFLFSGTMCDLVVANLLVNHRLILRVQNTTSPARIPQAHMADTWKACFGG